MKLDAIVGTRVGGGHAHLHSDGKDSDESTFRPKIIMPLADLPLGERLYSAATIRKWLNEEPSKKVIQAAVENYDSNDGSMVEYCRGLFAAKLEELK